MLEFLATAARARVVSANNSRNDSRGARFAHYFFPSFALLTTGTPMKSQNYPMVTAVAGGR
jgi:hypothetical protein